jgi:hypothetical protein
MKTMADGNSMSFVPHEGAGAFDNYLAMNLPEKPAKELALKLENWSGLHLTTRGEAHITVLTPIEFQKLRRVVSIREINELATQAGIQKSIVDIRCLGRGKLTIADKEESAFFVVVKSPELLAIRGKVAALFLSKGGRASEFNPDTFYPHITIGFTKRDLHFEDGIVKDETACIADLKMVAAK